MVNLLADVELDDPPRRPVRLERHEAGLITVWQLEPGWFRIVATVRERRAGAQGPVTFDELRSSVERIAGTDFGMHSARWMSYFTDATRQAERYRVGRVLLAGDAAHVHLPASGQGMGMGMQDAFNLGWKLAAVVRGEAPDTLLDTYHDERHAADAEILHLVRAQSVLCHPSPRVADLVDVMTDLIGIPEANDRLGAALSGLGISYQIPGTGTHRLLGRRVPDADICTRDGHRRIFELLRGARPVLLDLSGKAGMVGLAEAAAGWGDRVDVVAADCLTRVWRLAGGASIPPPAAVLIRPDGYVAWAGDDAKPDLPALHESLTTWSGPAVQPVSV
jgi:3-(3-hydroxy-phenyl)propionate hydroxylase